MRPASPVKVLHRSRILNRPFRNLQPVALTIGACLCFGCVHQVDRQNEARAISAFALPIDIAPHNRIGLAIGVSPAAASSLIASEPLAKGIQDNSFFIEEAYNQEPGVVQHILNVPIDFTNGSREIAPSFTQEWPVFSQTHQFSYTIPYLFTEDDNGMADMRLNYRLQAFMEDEYTPAFAPRLSLVLPTGDSDKGFGTGVMGYEFNLPFSKIVSDRWTLNFNAGMSVFPNAHQSQHLTNYNVGASAIYAVSSDFNLMLETLAGLERRHCRRRVRIRGDCRTQHDCDHFSWCALRLQLA